MFYFKDNYLNIKYPIAEGNNSGLRKAQLGAIHSIASHFTKNTNNTIPAIVTLPTGSGKTAVLIMTAFIERAKRVLIITPSRMVRGQITEKFEELTTLKDIGVVPRDIANPRVFEVVNRINTPEEWKSMYDYDVIVSTPNSASPALEDIPAPPEDLFDLLLIDEAHHSPAKTWNKLLTSFPKVKKVLFTATPFRRDRKEIKGKFIYDYSIKEAYGDKIFGKIEYIEVYPDEDENNDIAIAKKAEELLVSDRENGLEHLLMIRTDSKKKAEELKAIYEKHTKLKLTLIDSSKTLKQIKLSLEKLSQKELDGVICVSMLGEGFDLPNLKIAAIHAPHKSLEVTLQFIGRFARTGNEKLGKAKFIAVSSDIEIERAKLYEEGAIWQEIVENLSQNRLEKEHSIRETFAKFNLPSLVIPETEDLSLYALYPYNHVKIYKVSNNININNQIELSGFEIVYHQTSLEDSITVLIIRELVKPRWTNLDEFNKVEYDLVLIFYHQSSNLLFINSSRKNDSLYESLARQYSDDIHNNLPLYKINRVLANLENYSFFNIGMKNRTHSSNTESYRIITGPNAQDALSPTDGKLYNRGHVFGKGIENGEETTIGFSSNSKVWSNENSQIPEFLNWCSKLANKIISEEIIITGSGLDNLDVGTEIMEIPSGVIAVDWDPNIYKNGLKALYNNGNAHQKEFELIDLELSLDRNNISKNKIPFIIKGEGLNLAINYLLDQDGAKFQKLDHLENLFILKKSGEVSIIDFLNNNPINFYFHDLSRLCGNEFYRNNIEYKPFELKDIEVIDWEKENVDITVEDTKDSKLENGKISIQGFLKKHLDESDYKVVIYDHRTGEIADFITLTETETEIVIKLYHCKASEEIIPGNRVNDIYDVCGQSIKSTIWIKDNKTLCSKINSRLKSGSKFIKGDKISLRDIFEKSTEKKFSYHIIIVQPGISKTNLDERIALVLAAASEYIKRSQSRQLLLLASK